MAGNPTRKKGKKNQKHGRNKKFCERYAASSKREKNKALKLKRHLKKYPTDVCAQKALGV